ncbi:hypothetical protein EB795_03775 [Pseudomonas mandelii]|uniref:hypothetical protein n=1 Tax=Pseudomonas mandelii TaxID=75612 RepID=UPI0012B18DC1|nr:hypothetical protein [Pseudomonas mandelii]MSU93063.1 hypothetical protein [Pseudomonas mandelii]
MLTGIAVDGEDKTEELIRFIEIIGLSSIAAGRYSAFFATQLYCESMVMGVLTPERVMCEIRALELLEPVSVTKPAAQFQRLPLKGLWHKHYTVSGIPSIAVNVMNALKRIGTPEFSESVRQVEASVEERYFEKEDIDRYVREVVHTNYQKRRDAGEMTGEWIVYAVHEGRNYYLCLGTHKTGDDLLRQWIDLIYLKEFPFLDQILDRPT